MANQYKNWSDEQIKAVWEKGAIVPGYDPDKFRQDIAGAWIEYSKHGKTGNELGLGWEIDHRKPESKGGKTELANLRPLQWANNRAKGDSYPNWSSVVSSEDNKNVRKNKNWIIK